MLTSLLTLVLAAFIVTASASTDGCPKACTKIYLPVCGSDGKTYPNECVLRTTNCSRSPGNLVQLSYQGRCRKTERCSSVCPANYNPVCGSDGKTYSNQCALEVASCKAQHSRHHQSRSSRHQAMKIEKVRNGRCY